MPTPTNWDGSAKGGPTWGEQAYALGLIGGTSSPSYSSKPRKPSKWEAAEPKQYESMQQLEADLPSIHYGRKLRPEQQTGQPGPGESPLGWVLAVVLLLTFLAVATLLMAAAAQSS